MQSRDLSLPNSLKLIIACKIHRILSVVLAAKESEYIEPDNKGISVMIHELIEEKIIA